MSTTGWCRRAPLLALVLLVAAVARGAASADSRDCAECGLCSALHVELQHALAQVEPPSDAWIRAGGRDLTGPHAATFEWLAWVQSLKQVAARVGFGFRRLALEVTKAIGLAAASTEARPTRSTQAIQAAAEWLLLQHEQPPVAHAELDAAVDAFLEVFGAREGCAATVARLPEGLHAAVSDLPRFYRVPKRRGGLGSSMQLDFAGRTLVGDAARYRDSVLVQGLRDWLGDDEHPAHASTEQMRERVKAVTAALALRFMRGHLDLHSVNATTAAALRQVAIDESVRLLCAAKCQSAGHSCWVALERRVEPRHPPSARHAANLAVARLAWNATVERIAATWAGDC